MATIKNTNNLLSEAAANLPDNTSQDISPADVRSLIENVALSGYNKITDSALVGLKAFSQLPEYESGQGALVGGLPYISNKVTGPGTFVSADWDIIATPDLPISKITGLQTDLDLVDHRLLKASGTGVNTTYLFTAASGGTTFSVPELFGEIKSDEGYFDIHFTGASGVTVTDLSVMSAYIYIDKSLVLQQQNTTPTRQDWSRKIFVARISINTATNVIQGFEYLNNPLGNYANSQRDIYSFLLAQGVPFKEDQLITGRASDLGFDISAGSFLEFGGTGDINNPNIIGLDLVENAPFFLSTRTGFDAGGNTALPKFWDNGGTLTALGSTTLVGHRLYRFSNGNVCLQYGQANYANMLLAKAGVLNEPYVLNPALKNATFFGWWFIESTATNTGGTTLTDFREYTIGMQGGSSTGLTGAVLRGNNGLDFLDLAQTKINLGITSLGADDQTIPAATNREVTIPTDSSLLIGGIKMFGDGLKSNLLTNTFITDAKLIANHLTTKLISGKIIQARYNDNGTPKNVVFEGVTDGYVITKVNGDRAYYDTFAEVRTNAVDGDTIDILQ
jgi:hypothetical protein